MRHRLFVHYHHGVDEVAHGDAALALGTVGLRDLNPLEGRAAAEDAPIGLPARALLADQISARGAFAAWAWCFSRYSRSK